MPPFPSLFRYLLVLFFLNFGLLWAEDSEENYQISAISQVGKSAGKVVTVSEYGAFLNATALSDSQGFYNERMSGIERLGAPGRYTYTVLPGEEEKLIVYTDPSTALFYSDWKGLFLQNEPSYDTALKSNKTPIAIQASASKELLANATASNKTGNSWGHVKGVAGVVFALLVAQEAFKYHRRSVQTEEEGIPRQVVTGDQGSIPATVKRRKTSAIRIAQEEESDLCLRAGNERKKSLASRRLSPAIQQRRSGSQNNDGLLVIDTTFQENEDDRIHELTTPKRLLDQERFQKFDARGEATMWKNMQQHSKDAPSGVLGRSTGNGISVY